MHRLQAIEMIVRAVQVVQQQRRDGVSIARELAHVILLAAIVAELARRGKYVVDSGKVRGRHVSAGVVGDLALGDDKEVDGEGTVCGLAVAK